MLEGGKCYIYGEKLSRKGRWAAGGKVHVYMEPLGITDLSRSLKERGTQTLGVSVSVGTAGTKVGSVTYKAACVPGAL